MRPEVPPLTADQRDALEHRLRQSPATLPELASAADCSERVAGWAMIRWELVGLVDALDGQPRAYRWRRP